MIEKSKIIAKLSRYAETNKEEFTMSLKKMFVNGVAVLALTFAVTGCGIFDSSDENEEMFRIKKDKDAQTAVNPNALKGAAGDVNTIGGPGNGPGEWSNNALSDALNPYADFGTPIPGVNLPTVYFSFDRSIIGASEAPKLDEIAAYLVSNAGTGVVIEGNCDDRGSDEYNRALGERRALSAKEYLLNKGIADSRIRTISYGEERPAASNADEAGRAKNRRDDFVAVKLRK